MADAQLPQRWNAPTPPIAPIPVREPLAQEPESLLSSLLKLLALIRRHWFIIFGITAVSVALLIYRVRKEPRIYRATATVRLEDKASEISNGIGRPVSRPYYPMKDPILTQIEILQSQAVAESVAEREGLRLRAMPKGLPPLWATAVRVAANAP